MPKLLLIVLVLVLLATGCKSVRTHTTVFSVPEHIHQGNLVVINPDIKASESLEYAHYKKQFESKLAGVGYSIVNSRENAKYIAFISYGIDEGTNKIVSYPVYGWIGGGYSGYSGYIYRQPAFGVTHSNITTLTTYSRVVTLDIVDISGPNRNTVKKIYEAKAKSTGACGNIAPVFSEILEAIFTGFPGENGVTKIVSVKMDKEC